MTTNTSSMSHLNEENHKKYAIIFSMLSIILLIVACVGTAYAAAPTGTAAAGTLGAVAGNITGSVGNLAKLITAGSYVAGFGFAVGAILKFKAHKDNPTQIPVGTPIALVFIGAALIFLPSIFAMSGKTIFGTNASVGGIQGKTSF